MLNTRPRWHWGILAILWGLSAISFGSQEVVPIKKQAVFLLKVLSYDKNFEKRFSEGIHLLVVYNEGEEEAATEVVSAFKEAGKDGVKGVAVKGSTVAFQSVAELLERIETEGVNAIYIHPSTGVAPTPILQVTRGKKIPSLGSSKKAIEQGVSLGVYLRNGRPKLVVNLRALKVEETALSAEVLRLSTIIK